jgi:hypothetical protein
MIDSPVFFLSLSFVFLLIGIFIARKPLWVIEAQKAFYAKINWRMEPISLKKEIRNTRLMGLFLVFFVLGAILFFFMKGR